jgi:acyl carrier protein
MNETAAPIERETTVATTEEIRADLAEIVNEVAGIDADDVQLDKSFVDDLDVDSLSMVEVVVAAEEKFGVKIPDNEVQNLRTVGDAVSYIEKNA